MKLNDADKIYIGGAEASAVYAGAVLVWEAEGAAPSEYEPTLIVTSTYDPSYSGATGSGAGLRDGIDNAGNSVWASVGGNGDYIMADLGADVSVGNIFLAGIPGAFDGWGYHYNNYAPIRVASSAAPESWTFIRLVQFLVVDTPAEFAIDQTCRYIKIDGSAGSWLSFGEFRVYPPGGRRGV